MNPITPYQGWVISWSSSHFYHNPQWDDKKNQDTFGLCSRTEGHGHDYKLEVLFKAEASDSVRIKGTLNRLKEKLDHRNLNQLSEFAHKIPTTENIANWIFNHLKTETGIPDIRLRLWETESIWVEITTPLAPVSHN